MIKINAEHKKFAVAAGLPLWRTDCLPLQYSVIHILNERQSLSKIVPKVHNNI